MNHAASAEEPIVRPPIPAVRGARLDIRELTWRPFGRHVPVLSAITLTAEPGERILLAGPSGSGKSTLLRAIAGVLTTVESGELSGSIQLDGTDPREGGSSIGLLVQDPADAMVAGTVGREVAFGPENLGIPRDALWQRVHTSLESVRFPYGTDHAVSAVSGGEGQRLALAGVLALGPRLIVLDEPTAMLDPVTAAAVRKAIWHVVRESGATVIVVEHHLDGWLAEMDRVIVLNTAGEVAADGAIAETLREHTKSLAALGVWIPGIPAPAALSIAPELVTPARRRSVTGTPTVTAGAVTVIRTPRTGHNPGSSAVTTLRNVDAVARAGEILAIVGASGAGKSTLTALLAGLTAPTAGTVSAGDAAVPWSRTPLARWSSLELARFVGWVPQQAELAIVARTVREDALSTSRALGHSERTATARIDGLLAALGLDGLADADPHQLSGGELRRLALVGAIAHGPAVLVLDEPTVGQDRHTWAAVAGIITSARDVGVAVVVATHDPHLIRLADRTIRLEKGRVIDGGPDVTPAGRAAVAPTRMRDATALTISRPNITLAARCGPLSLLGTSILLVIGALFITTIEVGIIAVAVQLLLAPFVFGWRPPAARVLRRLLPGLLAVLSVGFSSWLLSSGQDAGIGLTATLRVTFFVLPGVIVAGLVDPFALGDHLAQRLHLPARPVVAAVAAMQRFDTLGEQWQQLARTRRVRGLDATRSPSARIRSIASLTFGLLVQALRQSARMAVAMESRAFSAPRAGGVRRTWAEPAPWSAADSLFIALGLIVAILPILFGILMNVAN